MSEVKTNVNVNSSNAASAGCQQKGCRISISKLLSFSLKSKVESNLERVATDTIIQDHIMFT